MAGSIDMARRAIPPFSWCCGPFPRAMKAGCVVAYVRASQRMRSAGTPVMSANSLRGYSSSLWNQPVEANGIGVDEFRS